MVTDALWSDYDSDDDPDLLLVGEWMPITIFNNQKGKLVCVQNKNNGLEYSSGWWWKVEAFDFDGDGDEDYVAGNLGLNYRYHTSRNEPFQVFADDFDENGKSDILLAHFVDNILYPVNDRHSSVIQLPYLKESFPTTNQFAEASFYEIYNPQILNQALHYDAYTFTSSYIENLGDGFFKLTPFENLAQITNQNSVVIMDIDIDGHEDIVMAGNLYASEVETVRNDAGTGIWLKGDGKGNFKAIPNYQSGLYADGDVRDMKIVEHSFGRLLLVAKNNDSLQVIRVNPISSDPLPTGR
jgi:hypothetical protein